MARVVVELVEPDEQQVGERVGQRLDPSPELTSAAWTSSSVKKALPSARSTMPRSAVSVSGSGCSESTRARTSSSGSGSRSIRLTPGSRDHSAAALRSGCRRCRSSLR